MRYFSIAVILCSIVGILNGAYISMLSNRIEALERTGSERALETINLDSARHDGKIEVSYYGGFRITIWKSEDSTKKFYAIADSCGLRISGDDRNTMRGYNFPFFAVANAKNVINAHQQGVEL